MADQNQSAAMYAPKMTNGQRMEGHGQQAHQANGSAINSKERPLTHTLTACCRCRKKKTKCDPGLPRCGPCERSNAKCEYHDTSKNRTMPRSYVTQLQKRVRDLEEELSQLSKELYNPPDADVMVRSGGYVRFGENDEARYLGPSSGIAITRLVMELAKQQYDTKSIKEVVPDVKAQQIKDTFKREEAKPTSKVYPLISDVAAQELPIRGLTDDLVGKFMQKAQYMFPTLHEPSFEYVVEDVYAGSADPYKNFTLRMVLAISMQRLDTQYAGLADSYYLAALPYLEKAIKPMNLGTLQCFSLMAQYSLLTPTRTAAYWVVGLAARLCQELGITEENIIAPIQNHKPRFDALEVDMRRRLFWIITSLEFGLAHSLGRPSAFGTSFDHVDIKFFEPVDDQYITANGVVPGCPQSLKKRIAIHFFKMRLLQAEIRRILYLNRQDKPTSDEDIWFKQMQKKLTDWLQSCPKQDGGSGLGETWFTGRYYTMVVFLYRPSPQVPRPTPNAAEKCFEACIFLIYMQKEQIDTGSIDLTWIFTQTLFMAMNTILWSLSYPEIRRDHPKEKLKKDLQVAKEAIGLASIRWPGVESALELYRNLITACLKAYDGSSDASYVVESLSNRPSPASINNTLTPPSMSSPETVFGSSPHSDNSHARPSPREYFQEYDVLQVSEPHSSPSFSDYSQTDSTVSSSYQKIPPQPLQQPAIDFASTYPSSALPSITTYGPLTQGLPAFHPHIFDATPQQFGQYSSIGDQYSQYFHTPYIPQQLPQPLNQETQIELMRSLENDWVVAPEGWK